uniref:Glycosyltransferase 61 catalytic domain-containing protein n=1 Tax=Clastoptera arizonana TaxID=38151 RepID=A0A1B6BYW6_9HEMI
MLILGIFSLFVSLLYYYMPKYYFSSCNMLQFLLDNYCYSDSSNSIFFNTKNVDSSLWCHEEIGGNKVCEFQYLCFVPNNENHIVFMYTDKSSIFGLKSKEELKNISLSSVLNHNGVLLKLSICNSYEHSLDNFINLRHNVLLLWRFKSDNIMHVIHDDLIPIFTTYKELCKGNVKECVQKYQLVFVDGEDPGPHYDWYKLFSYSDPLFLNEELNQTICFKKGRVGLSTRSVWYQYGFNRFHGPTHSYMNGKLLQEFTEFILDGFKIYRNNYNLNESIGIFFNRKLNRKIINENYIIDEVKNMYTNIFSVHHFTLYNLDLSQNDTVTILSLLVRAKFVVGMHGSAMILSMFIPQTASIVELFPFGIQPEYVSPLRAMCDLPDVLQYYQSWVNINESNSITYPDNTHLLGGISHLDIEMQQTIKNIKLVPPVECCHNPLYLFRMYQDTLVDKSFSEVLEEIFLVQRSTLSDNIFTNLKNDVDRWYFPSPVTNITCSNINENLILSWNKPYNAGLNKIEYRLAINVGNQDMSLSTFSTSVQLNLSSYEKSINIQIWIKSVFDNSESIDAYFTCIVFNNLPEL